MFIIVSINDDNIPVILNLYYYIFTRSEILFVMIGTCSSVYCLCCISLGSFYDVMVRDTDYL